MAIDASIYGQQQPQPFNDPFKQLMAIRQQQQQRQLVDQQIRSGQALEESRRQDTAKQAQLEAESAQYDQIKRSTIGNPDFTRDAFLKTVLDKAPHHYEAALKTFEEQDKDAAALKKTLTDVESANQAAESAKAQALLHGQQYTANSAGRVKALDYSPAALELMLKENESHFPQFQQQADQIRQQVLAGAPIKGIVDGLIAQSSSTQNADTNAATAAVDIPEKETNTAIRQKQLAGMRGGLLPNEQVTDAREQQRLKLEQQRVAQEGQRLARAPDARTDKSYQTANASLENLRKPIADQSERLARLADSVNQGTPQADALIAPELLTVMAGGAGSGLRMNEAEIARIIGGRSNFESLKSALNKWQIDPSKALSITSSQRDQIRKLMTSVQDRATAKLDAIYEASQGLIDAGDVETHRRIVSETRRKIDTINAGSSGGGGGTMKIRKIGDPSKVAQGPRGPVPSGWEEVK